MLTKPHRSKRWVICWIWIRYPVNRSKFDASQSILCISQSVKIVPPRKRTHEGHATTDWVAWVVAMARPKSSPDLSKLASACLSRDNTLPIAKRDSLLIMVFDYNDPCLGQIQETQFSEQFRPRHRTPTPHGA